MISKQGKVFRLHGSVYIGAFVSIFILSAILLNTQTDVWQQIKGYIPDEITARLYQGMLSSRNLTDIWLNASHSQAAFDIESVQHIDKLATPYVDGMRHNFELVRGISSQVYVYGALWNVQNVRLISIIVQGHVFKNLHCVLYYSVDKSGSGVYVKPIVKELHTYTSPYTSASITCPANDHIYKGNIPLFIGLVEGDSVIPKQTFLVQNYGKETGVTHEFTVCIPAIFHMKSAGLLVQKIEMIRMFGAGRLVLYNASMSSNVDAVLKMYTKEYAEGRETLEVVVLPWKLPLEDNKTISIPYFAQQLAIDDCMYRFKRLSKYMAFNDLDEYMIPFKHENWSTLVAERRRLKPNSIGWLFRCSVLNKDRPSPAAGYEEDYLRYGSSIFGLTSRDKHVFPPNDRAKLIVDPTTIEEMGVHLIWEGGGDTDNLPLDVGMLFHYRVPLLECTPQVKETRMADKYGKRLAARLQEIWSKLPGVELGSTPFKAKDHSKCNKS